MNEGQSQSNLQSTGSPKFNFERSLWSPSQANDENTPLNYSPFQFETKSRFLSLNFNSSPKERRVDNLEVPFWEDRGQLMMSPQEVERKFKPKLNPLVMQRKTDKAKAKEERLATAEEDFACLFLRNDTVGLSGFGEEDAQKSSRFAGESTVFESNLKSERQDERKKSLDVRENSVLFSDSEDEEGKGGRKGVGKKSFQELPVKKLVKMEPLFTFFVQFYNGNEAKPAFDFQNQYELTIIRAILKQMGLKNADSLPIDPHVLHMSLLTTWKTPQRSRNLMALVLRMATRILRIRFAFAQNLTDLPLNDLKKRFVEAYFGDQFQKFPGLASLDLESHKALTRLNKEQMGVILSTPAFDSVFSNLVRDELPFFLNAYRTRKLGRIFSKMEEAFLSTRTDEEAVRQIIGWMTSGKFRWVIDTPSYETAIVQSRKR